MPNDHLLYDQGPVQSQIAGNKKQRGTMFARHVLTDEERMVDPELGYPRGYAKLCRNAHIQMQGLITPYTEGPPQRFLPYALQPEDMAKLKEFNQLFPITESEDRDPSSARRYADSLWQQLDHLGNAGFDPAKFRVDPYGNVLYMNADPASPLAWEVDHWFPHSRGGKTVQSNLRLVQWQVNQRKQNKLEFLMPWWDLQLGISVNQFLSIFASKNADFRQRAFSLLFFAGENEPLEEGLVADCHSWPQHFREKKGQFGLAAAAIVRVQKQVDDTMKLLNVNRPINPAWPAPSGTPGRKRWTIEEEEALRRALQRFGPGNWKEIKEYEPLFRNRSTVQIKDKYRLLRGDWELEKENRGDDLSDKQIILSRAVQKESRMRKIREEEIRIKQEEISELDKELTELQQRNEAERLALEDLESVLIKHKRRVEKQRRWSETQSSYRMCLEKMIRDAMHQSIVYKEQGRLNQAACNALMARLESQKATCDASEMELIKKFKQREDLETLLRPYSEKIKKRPGEDDTASCSKENIKREMDKLLTCCPLAIECADFAYISAAAVKEEPNTLVPKESSPLLLQSKEESSKHLQKELRLFLEEEVKEEKANISLIAPKEQGKVEIAKVEEALSIRNLDTNESAKERPRPSEVEESDLDVLIVGYEYEGARARAREAESVGENVTLGTSLDFKQIKFEGLAKEDCASMVGENDRMHKQWKIAKEDRTCKPVDDDQLHEMFDDALAMQGKAEEAMADAIAEDEKEEDEDERIKRIGKSNLDKWLQMLLLTPRAKEDLEQEDDNLTTTQTDVVSTAQDHESTNVFGGLMRKLNIIQQQPHQKKIRSFEVIEEKEDTKHPNARDFTIADAQKLTNIKEKTAIDLGLVEKLQCLQLACDDGPQTKLDCIATTTVNEDVDLLTKHIRKTSEENAGAEMEKQNTTIRTTATVNNAGATCEQGFKSLNEQEEPTNFGCAKGQQAGRLMRGNSDLTESGGIITKNSNGQDSKIITGQEEGDAAGIAMRSCGDGDGSQHSWKEKRLKRSESARVSLDAHANSSLWGLQRIGGQCKERKMGIGEESEVKRAGDDGLQGVMLLKNGLNASIKTCTHVWKRAVKKFEGVTAGTDQNRAD
eukprot:Gb_23424 [translate_table: standard]